MDFNKILKGRELSPNTIRNYESNITRLYKILFSSKNKPDNLDWLLWIPTETIINEINNNVKSNTSKNVIFNSIVVMLQELGHKDLAKPYSLERDKLNTLYQDKVKSNQLSKTQAQNWINKDEIRAVLKKYKKEVDFIYTKEIDDISRVDKTKLRNYIILYLYYHYPLRNDLYEINIIGEDDIIYNDKNYLLIDKNMTIILNKYKTSKTYGQIKIKVNTPIKKEIERFLTINETGYLIPNGQYNDHTTSEGIYYVLRNIFLKEYGKSIGSSMMRHIYLTHKYKDKYIESKKDSKIMGHSLDQQKNYILF